MLGLNLGRLDEGRPIDGDQFTIVAETDRFVYLHCPQDLDATRSGAGWRSFAMRPTIRPTGK